MSTKREAAMRALEEGMILEPDARESIRSYVTELEAALKASAELREEALKAAAREAWRDARRGFRFPSFDDWWSSREGGK